MPAKLAVPSGGALAQPQGHSGVLIGGAVRLRDRRRVVAVAVRAALNELRAARPPARGSVSQAVHPHDGDYETENEGCDGITTGRRQAQVLGCLQHCVGGAERKDGTKTSSYLSASKLAHVARGVSFPEAVHQRQPALPQALLVIGVRHAETMARLLSNATQGPAISA